MTRLSSIKEKLIPTFFKSHHAQSIIKFINKCFHKLKDAVNMVIFLGF